MTTIFYYWLKTKEGNEIRVIEDKFLGELGEFITYKGTSYIISDYILENVFWDDLYE